jgi:hypothetical protein
MNRYRFSHMVSISALPTGPNDPRDKNVRLESVLRALVGFTPSPIRVGQRAYDDKKKLIRIDFGIEVSSNFEAQLEAVRLRDALMPILATAEYQPSAWSLESPLVAM